MTISDPHTTQWVLSHWKAWGLPSLLAAAAIATSALMRHSYAWTLVRYYEARKQIEDDTQTFTAANTFTISEDMIVAKSGLPHWLIRRSLRWERRSFSL